MSCQLKTALIAFARECSPACMHEHILMCTYVVALVCTVRCILFDCMLVAAWHLNALLVDARPDMLLFVACCFFVLWFLFLLKFSSAESFPLTLFGHNGCTCEYIRQRWWHATGENKNLLHSKDFVSKLQVKWSGIKNFIFWLPLLPIFYSVKILKVIEFNAYI